MTSLPIYLPQGFTPKVSEKDQIKENHVLAEKKDSHRDAFAKVATDLNVSPQKAKEYLKKNPGDIVREGDILAEKSEFLSKKEVISKVDGTFYRYDEKSGDMIIRVEGGGEAKTITSPVDGEVIEVSDEKIVIKVEKEAILGEIGCGKSASGDVVNLGEKVDFSEIDIKISGKIIAAKKISREAVAKAMGVGAIGIIAQEIPEEEFQNLEEKNIDTPVIMIKEGDFNSFIKDYKKVIMDGQKKIIVKL